MELQQDVRDLLVSRRARLSPDRAGLPTYGGHRRVAGLRREEVALLAGVPGDDLVLIAYTADPASHAEEKLQLLAAWATTPPQTTASRPTA